MQMTKILLENICMICMGDYILKGECVELYKVATIEGCDRYTCKHILKSAMEI